MRRFFTKCSFIVAVIFLTYIFVIAAGSVFTQKVFAAEGTHRLVHINLNGELIPTPPAGDMPPIIVGNRTMVPVRHVFEALGAVVDFHEAMQRVIIVFEGNLILLHIGDYNFFFNDTVHSMDIAPQLIGGRTMVPVAFVASTMGFNIRWDDATSTVFLTSAPTADNNTSGWNFDDNPDFSGISVDNSDPIEGESNIQTQIYGITWNESRTQFTISARSNISAVDWHMMADGRLVIDIVNARPALPGVFAINNGFITTIRTGHNIVDGNDVTRVVFDLNATVTYRITMSADRRHIIVTFEPNEITNIAFSTANGIESITITGSTMPIVDVFYLFNPNRLVIDIANARLDFNGAVPANGTLVNALRQAQFDPTTTRIVADLSGAVSHTIEQDITAGTTTIHISRPTHQNIYYDGQSGRITLVRPAGLDIANILEFDQYLQRRYSFILPGDFEHHFGYGTFLVRDGGINNIEIITQNGLTTIAFNTNSIKAFLVEYSAAHIYITPVNPRQKYDFIVIIDPGHGGAQPGAVHHGFRESDLVLDVALMVMEMLNRDGLVKAYTTRYTDVTVPNSQRSAIANDIGDIFISIHFNAFNGIVTGTETLYSIHAEEAGLSLNSRQLAQILQDDMIAELGLNNRGLWTRNDLPMLRDTKIPSALVEIAFMDTLSEAQLIHQPEYRRRAAEAIVRSIYRVMEIYTPPR
ncbi:MAG: N-acetylmuramoyl-L-alanine amidase family protein [Defluviitaleaceae bacterium]|nr:N-acetylmuramoyl-L-alanine amidase family protein [Defluviitaleaceae bacterium]